MGQPRYGWAKRDFALRDVVGRWEHIRPSLRVDDPHGVSTPFSPSSSTHPLPSTMSHPTSLDALPPLERQETDSSKSDLTSLTTTTTIVGEKGYAHHIDHVQVPQTIDEERDEDADGNVGVAAYEQSKQVAEIVSR